MTDVQTCTIILRRRVKDWIDDSDRRVELIRTLNTIQQELLESAEFDPVDAGDLTDGETVDIPPGKAVKFSFQASHAPHWVIQLDNGLLVGLMAHVEFPGEKEQTVFGPSKDKFMQHLNDLNVESEIVDVEQTPFRPADIER